MKINEFVPDSSIFKENGKISNNVQNNEESFGGFLKQKLDEVNAQQLQAEDTTQSFLQGDNTDIHKVMLDTEEAKMSLELAVQIRNKFVEAYQELSRTQL